MKHEKIGIVGAGHVGSHVASALLLFGVCDEIVLLDIDREKALAQAMDLADTVTAGSTAEVTLTFVGGDKLSFPAEVRAAGDER